MTASRNSANQSMRVKRMGFELFWHLVPPGLFFVWMFRYYPYRDMFVMNLDEGVNLTKALLISRGFHLYSQIWSDQPPLFSVLLNGFFRLTGYEVNYGRLLVLLFSCLLLWAMIQSIRMIWGNVAALAGFFLLVLLPGYMSLSTSVLIGLPALTFTMLSFLMLVLWHRSGQTAWLWLSGLFFSLSIFTKLIVGFLLPIFLVGITIEAWSKAGDRKYARDFFRPAFVWGISLTVVSAILYAIFIGPADALQLIQPHLQARQLDVFQAADQSLTIRYHISKAWPTIWLAGIGTLGAILKRRWLAFYPFAWAVVGYGLLSTHSPVWDHQQLVVSIPLAMMAAGGIAEAFEQLVDLIRNSNRRMAELSLVLFTMAGLIALVWAQVPPLVSQWQLLTKNAQKLTSAETVVLRKMDKYASSTNWVLTDLLMYAFREKLAVPPELAVLTSKRVETGNLSPQELLSITERYAPEQILIGRFEFSALDDYLDENYRLIYERPDLRLYLRNGLP